MLPSTSGRQCMQQHGRPSFSCVHRSRRSLIRSTRSCNSSFVGYSTTAGSGSSSSSSSSSRDRVLMRSSQQPQAAPSKNELELALQQAIASEDYATAARLKQKIIEIELQDPLTGLKWALEGAIAEERYADAARLRDQIKQLEEVRQPQPPDMTGLTSSSNTVTHGIRVKVRSYYVPAQSRPELGQFFFAYAVSISNESSKVVMLERRHWVITDGNGKLDHVRGPGVIGEQPILKPGQTFEYQSACPLYTTSGTMEGEYEMITLNDQGEWLDRIEVKIGKFALIKPDMA